jgi:hypothetical protein
LTKNAIAAVEGCTPDVSVTGGVLCGNRYDVVPKRESGIAVHWTPVSCSSWARPPGGELVPDPRCEQATTTATAPRSAATESRAATSKRLCFIGHPLGTCLLVGKMR